MNRQPPRRVPIGQQKQINIRLGLAGLAETVTVTGESPVVDPSSSPGVVSYAHPQLVDWVTPPTGHFNTEAYDHITDNPFKSVLDHPLSTFSIDVDRASYANTRRFLNE